MVETVKGVELRLQAKFRQDRSNRAAKIYQFFDFSKIAAAAILDFGIF